jgi:hypothetical protein
MVSGAYSIVLFSRLKDSIGMFLYARVVMDNITSSLDLDQIREELYMLPESLEEAYARAPAVQVIT